ncbi:cytochrome-c peroxidase [Acidobacteria bacterium AH-259-G07]|nr:cytochrome-c peroxidase [Acidobacteria bacterium AH-259-G07]
MHRIFLGLLLPIVLASWGCTSGQGPTQGAGSFPIGTPVEIKAPLGLPPVLIPADNPPTAETISLGRRLYYDPMLSVDDTVACASCHHPDFGFTDGKPVSEGVNGQKGGRNAPTVFNAAYYATQFWDGRAPNLEKQAEGPVQNPIEMAHTLEGVEQKLTADPTYQAEFEKAFGPGPITYEKVEKAIASFERTVISGNSPFDRYFYGGDETALSEAAKRGLEIFRNPQKGNCTACHPIGLFTDNQFHNIGVGVDDQGELTDVGRYEVSKNEADRGAFKTPSLRNIALTAPYMHDGSLKTLKEVVDFYIGGGNSNPHLDPQLKVLTPTTETGEVNWSGADLEAFLEALTGEIPSNVGSP